MSTKPAEAKPQASNLAPGLVLGDGEVPKVFQPLQIRSVTLPNRFVVSPISDDGFMTDWHIVHLGQFALQGAGLIFTEAVSVTPNGRITPSCAGLWKDEHIGPMKRVTDFIHSQSSLVGIQLAHAGRKASTLPPFHAKPRGVATLEDGGWLDVVGPSNEPWNSDNFLTPNELTLDEISNLISSFREAAIRADKAGFDVLEIHGAHGYLIHSFYSPLSNHRTDKYGGSFENRARFLLEVTQAVKEVWPSHKPVFVRLSCSDWVQEQPSWDIDETIELCGALLKLEVDLIDCSSSGNSPLQKIPAGPGFQVPFSKKIRSAYEGKMMTGAVGLITEPEMANDIISRGEADLIFMAREFLRNPGFVKQAAHHFKLNIKWPNQHERGKPRPKHEAF